MPEAITVVKQKGAWKAKTLAFIKNIKGWQVAVAVLLGVALVVLINKITGHDGLAKTMFTRTADGIGWAMDETVKGVEWVADGIAYEFQDWDWTFWD